MNAKLRVLLLGDLVGFPGRVIFQKHINSLKEKFSIDFVVVNGENSCQGKGITSRIVRFFRHNGVDVVTSGNHIWQNKEIYSYLSENNDLLRPENFPTDCPGTGVGLYQCNGYSIGVINLQGRVFMREHVNDPFRTADSVLTFLKSRTPIILVDFHAETTSEKMALAYYLDGRVSALVGTHTHIQTADERILPNGTAYITDLGMAGALNSMLGMKKEPIIKNFLTQMPQKFEVDINGPMVLSGVWVEIDTTNGKATHIERVRIVDEEIHLSSDEKE